MLHFINQPVKCLSALWCWAGSVQQVFRALPPPPLKTAIAKNSFKSKVKLQLDNSTMKLTIKHRKAKGSYRCEWKAIMPAVTVAWWHCIRDETATYDIFWTDIAITVRVMISFSPNQLLQWCWCNFCTKQACSLMSGEYYLQTRTSQSTSVYDAINTQQCCDTF